MDRLAAVGDTRMFPAAFSKEFSGSKVKAFLQCSAQRLLEDDIGGVLGFIVQAHGIEVGQFKVCAPKGVNLATGGYGANHLLRRRFQHNDSEGVFNSGFATC